MIYENYKKGMFRVFIVLSIPLELVTYFQYDLSFTNKFFYSLEILSQTLVIFWCIYLISLLVAKPFIGFLGKSQKSHQVKSYTSSYTSVFDLQINYCK